MLQNRSAPPCTVVPVLYYPDPAAAAAWLSEAFGFSVRLRIANHRIQMHAGDGCFVIAEGAGPSDRADLAKTHVTMIRVEDVRARCEQARAAGARILQEPTDHMYGERQFNVEDFAGHRWTFTQTLADIAPETWGGTPVNL